jgi:hypothetical protein
MCCSYKHLYYNHTFVLAVFALFISTASSEAYEQDIEYRQFRLSDVSCDVAVSYRSTDDHLEVAVSAVAYGNGFEFRKWAVTDIKLSINAARVRANKENRFYATKESLFRFPAAVVFAAIGTQLDVPGSALRQGITKAGMAAGLGLLVMTAKGDIAGQTNFFDLGWDTVDSIYEGRDFIEITVENTDMHLKKTMKINLMKGPPKERRFDFGNMRQDELAQIMDTLEDQICNIRKNQVKYKYGIDLEYGEMQNKIEALEVERAEAYKVWYERQLR